MPAAVGGETADVMISKPVESRMRIWMPAGIMTPLESLLPAGKAGITFIRIGSAGSVMVSAGWIGARAGLMQLA